MSAYRAEELKAFLDTKVLEYNQPGFIENDPIVIPHAYSLKEDIEITAFWASMLAWGQRITIINKCKELFESHLHSLRKQLIRLTDRVQRFCR